jgi:hypothetical protein
MTEPNTIIVVGNCGQHVRNFILINRRDNDIYELWPEIEIATTLYGEIVKFYPRNNRNIMESIAYSILDSNRFSCLWIGTLHEIPILTVQCMLRCGIISSTNVKIFYADDEGGSGVELLLDKNCDIVNGEYLKHFELGFDLRFGKWERRDFGI